MTVSANKRKSQVVMFGDVVGYSRLMEADEDDTHSRMQLLSTNVVIPLVGAHSGVIVKGTGDGFLAAFDSPIDAIRSAVALQTTLVESAAGFPPERRILFRLALNICDAIVDAGDLFGDGVNVAARLQAYAEPGDIVLTTQLAQLAGRALESATTFDMGELHLKNISRPVRVVGIRIGSLQRLTAPAPLPAADARPSIAVVPFRKPIEPYANRYLVDAIVDGVIHGLAATKELFVISRGSTKRFARGKVDARQIGQELNVRYVLSGAVQREGERLRVSTELADTDTGLIIRSDHFDGLVSELIQLQEQIAISATKTLAPGILEWELRRSLR